MNDIIFKGVPILLGLVILIILIKIMYTQAKPNEVVILTGPRKKKRTLIGKGGFRIPFFEKISRLSLEMVAVDVKTTEPVPTLDFINVNVDAVAKIKIPNSSEMIDIAAENFLDKDTKFISESVQDVLEGNIREIVGSIPLKQLINDRKAFIDKVQDNAAPDLRKMGLEIVTINVQNFTDEHNAINDLGVDNLEEIRKTAKISRISAEQEVNIEQAKADLAINEERVKADKTIAEQQNELAIKKSELLKIENTKKAEAELAYQISMEIQRKQKEQVTADANAVKAEREIEIKRSELISERNNEEDAKLYQKQKEAEGIKALAEARAKALEMDAAAEAMKIKAVGEAEAEKVKAIGLAEADRVKALGLAEAEALEKKALAMQKYGEAAVLDTVMKAYVEMSANVVKPLEKIDNITLYGEGGQAKLVEDTTKSLTQLDNGLKDALGIDVKTLMSSFMGTKLGVEKANKGDENLGEKLGELKGKVDEISKNIDRNTDRNIDRNIDRKNRKK